MISAIGAGVGEDFDILKSRYHKIIVMTDADVDGAHIRTLLLTFFYRQMTNLIKNGYIYIAQPPLYKVKKGKKEFYVDTESEMENILIEFARENTELKLKKNSKVMFTSEKIKEIARLSRRISEIKRAIENKGIKFSDLLEFWTEKKKFPTYWIKYKNEQHFIIDDTALAEFMESQGSGQVDLFSSEEQDYKLVELFESRELDKSFKKIEQLEIPLQNLNDKLFVVNENGKSADYSLIEISGVLKEIGKKGLTVVRYKGLGEMNPLQLWETTMEPAQRRLKKVNIEDAAKAEEIFTVLMGESVEPRRQFIEKYAREVKNLDI